MTNKPNDGGAAFPLPPVLSEGGPESYWSQPPQPGMSLRDYFAGQALAGILLDAGTARQVEDHTIAKSAYRLADAMLAEREKSK